MKVAASPQIYTGAALKWYSSHQSLISAFNREPINLNPEPFHSKKESFARRPLTHG